MYQRRVLSKAPVSGIVLKLSDVGELDFAIAPESYRNLLRKEASIDTLTLISAVNNLLLLRPHDTEVHRALEEMFLRPEYRTYLSAAIVGSETHPVFRLAFSRLGNLLTAKILLCALSEHASRRCL